MRFKNDQFDKLPFDQVSDFFFPAGSLSSNEDSSLISKDIIEYTEYSPEKIQSISLNSSPTKLPDLCRTLSKSQTLLSPTQSFSINHKTNSKEILKLKIKCIHFESQNNKLRKELSHCHSQIEKLKLSQVNLQEQINQAKTDLSKSNTFLQSIFRNINELLDCEFSSVDEHYCSFIEGQVLLFKSKVSRQQSLHLKLRSACEMLSAENKSLKKKNEELKAKNLELCNMSNEQKVPKEKYNYRTMSAKDRLSSGIDTYLEALKDLKNLSDKANRKINGTRNPLPKPVKFDQQKIFEKNKIS